jgi:U3 small nucleolar RNA-associated protein 14
VNTGIKTTRNGKPLKDMKMKVKMNAEAKARGGSRAASAATSTSTSTTTSASRAASSATTKKSASTSRQGKRTSNDDPEELSEDQNGVSDSDDQMGDAEFAEFNELENDSGEDGSDEEDVELEDISSRLMTAIDKFSAANNANKYVNDHSNRTQQMKEASLGVELDNNAVTMDALLNALSNTRGISAVRKSLTELEKSIEAPKYVDKIVSERIERSITYKDKSEDMKKWQDQVVENRNAKTLDLAQDKRDTHSYRSLVVKHTPTTDLEKDVQMVMVKCGLRENSAAKTENELLMGHGLSLKEIKQKQAELAKVKALMFYEQMKRHRLNKIKSKAYRRIRKRQKMRASAKAGDGHEESASETEGEEDNEEEVAAKRVQERMNLRHQNTGSWAKMAKSRGQFDKSLKYDDYESGLLC